jgi:hypothetical protein
MLLLHSAKEGPTNRCPIIEPDDIQGREDELESSIADGRWLFTGRGSLTFTSFLRSPACFSLALPRPRTIGAFEPYIQRLHAKAEVKTSSFFPPQPFPCASAPVGASFTSGRC